MTERLFRVHFENPDWERFPEIKPAHPYFETIESNLAYEISVAIRMGCIITRVEFAS